MDDSDAGHQPGPGQPRRPSLRSSLDDLTGDLDPAVRTALAHETAAIVVHAGRTNPDPELTQRVIALADEVGLEALAELWRQSPPDTLPGTLWSLYLLQTWVGRDGHEVGRLYRAGRHAAEVAHVVAGVAEPYGPDEVRALGQAVLSNAFDGDFAVALERAAAFCRVLALGRLERAADSDGLDEPSAARHTQMAGGNARLADQLEGAAALWRTGDLG